MGKTHRRSKDSKDSKVVKDKGYDKKAQEHKSKKIEKGEKKLSKYKDKGYDYD